MTDRDVATLAAINQAFTIAVGYYECPCGSAFDFPSVEPCLEDYAALNRWLGRHVGLCDVAREAAGGCADPICEITRLTNKLAQAQAERDTAKAVNSVG